MDKEKTRVSRDSFLNFFFIEKKNVFFSIVLKKKYIHILSTNKSSARK